MNKQKEVIPIFFTIDNAYAPYLGTAITSLICNASKEYNYRIIVLHQELSAANQAKLSALAKNQFEIQFVPMQRGMEDITDRMSNRLRCDYFTLTIYFRLFIPAMFPEYDKGIYLDSDIVVPGDISKLYQVELGDNLLGASLDHSIQNIPPLVKYMDEGVGVGKHSYINSGVLLMNLRKLREVSLETRFLELLNTYHFDCIAPDQDYLNVMCNGKIVYLSEEWDAMPVDDREPIANPKLIHYNLFSKPWCYDNVEYGEYFWKYASDSGFLDQILAAKASYSDAQKKSDSNCLQLLLDTAEKIAAAEENFRTVFNGGKEKRL